MSECTCHWTIDCNTRCPVHGTKRESEGVVVPLETAWRIVRESATHRLREEIIAAGEASIWHADSMGEGDISEFGSMMNNLEQLLGVPDPINWDEMIADAERRAVPRIDEGGE